MSQKAVARKAETALDSPVVISAADGEDPAFASLGASLAEIRKLKGVLGYIMRGKTSAVLDLAETDKIGQYAFLS